MTCALELDLREGYEIYNKMVLADSPIVDHRPVREIKIATSLSLLLSPVASLDAQSVDSRPSCEACLCRAESVHNVSCVRMLDLS